MPDWPMPDWPMPDWPMPDWPMPDCVKSTWPLIDSADLLPMTGSSLQSSVYIFQSIVIIH